MSQQLAVALFDLDEMRIELNKRERKIEALMAENERLRAQSIAWGEQLMSTNERLIETESVLFNLIKASNNIVIPTNVVINN